MTAMIVSVQKAVYLKDYQIALTFNDGTHQELDFQNFLQKSRNPMTRKFLDITKFKSFEIEHGDLVWNNYELCFPIWDLYTNNIEHKVLSSEVS